jgi:membrane protease YdiL (CAAX protease family)
MAAVTRLLRRAPLLAFFLLAYAASAIALAVIGWPSLDATGGTSIASLVMFPVIVIAVGVAGLVMTAVTDGRRGLRQLRIRMTRWRLGRWWLILLAPPLGMVAALTALQTFLSPSYAPHFLLLGIGAGLLAGLFEETGWTGFAYARMSARFGALGGALLLGVFWALWHFPVVDSLGAASPHRASLPLFFASFAAVLVATRVLIAWLYTNTGSVLGAQLLHATSTGSLVVLSPAAVSPEQEALWYLVYAGLLWILVALVVARFGATLAGRSREQASLARASSHAFDAGIVTR